MMSTIRLTERTPVLSPDQAARGCVASHVMYRVTGGAVELNTSDLAAAITYAREQRAKAAATS